MLSSVFDLTKPVPEEDDESFGMILLGILTFKSPPFFNKETKKFIDIFKFFLISSSDKSTDATEVPKQRTFFNWNL